jgi:hypothetical protein
MTPAQLKSAMEKVQREQKRATDKYNREARKYRGRQ